ncbi:MAG: RluA family pseudouridine synthase [Aquificae bacterium]|nr:RluA family pseudouridine synthase [Aquificota bacterium]
MEREGELLTFEVDAEKGGTRLDKFLSQAYPELSRSYLKDLIEEGFVKVDGETVKKPSKKVKAGQTVELFVPPPKELELKPEPLPLKVIYEDDDLAVVYKPPGMVVHPSPGYESGTLVNALLYHLDNLSSIGGVDRPGIVHRLDRGTAGVMVVAKNDKAHRELARQFHDRLTEKRYKALVTPPPPDRHAVVDLPIGRSLSDRKKFSVYSAKAKDAKTEYWLKEQFDKARSALLDVKIYTGRTHQIRVHLKSKGMTIWGDETYGFKKGKLPKEVQNLVDLLPEGSFWLLAYKLGFYHPRTGEWLQFEVEPPEEYRKVLDRLRELENS